MFKRAVQRALGPPLVSRDAALWALRLFIGREPNDAAELEFHRGHTSIESLRTAFARTREFQAFLRRIDAQQGYRAPLFLLAPPEDTRIPWQAGAPPSLAAPVSQLCTAGQVEEPAFARWCAALDLAPNPHRKVWEFCYVAAVIEAAGLLRPGIRALGFGVGREPLPALMARHGLSVVATDAPEEVVRDQGWAATGQHAAALESLARPRILATEALARAVSFRPVDMNAIPADLRDFDLCWSACALEHLGSLEHGLRFVEASLDTLRPGGLAVHTTEFNLSSNDATFEARGLSLYRRRDIEALLGRLVAQGHRVWPLNLHPGSAALDTHIDLPPYALPHLKLEVGQYVTTSIGIAVRKAG